MGNGWGTAAVIASLMSIGLWKSLDQEQKDQAKKFSTDLFRAAGDVYREEREQKRLAKEAESEEEYPGVSSPPLESAPSPNRKQDNGALAPGLITGPLNPLDLAHRSGIDSEWHKLILPPSVVLILGKRGAGKSSLAYRLLEIFRYQLTPYVVGAPSGVEKYLPDWVGIETNLDAIPPKSVVLIDEAYLRYHARQSQARRSVEMSRLLNLSRQRQVTLIFVTQEARQLDKNVSSSANVIVYKEPGLLQREFERRELKPITEKALRGFAGVGGNRQPWSFVYAPDADFAGMVQNGPPSFWSDRLSRSFAESGGAEQQRAPKRLSRDEKKAKAAALRAAEWSLSQIATELGVSKGTIINYLRDYPYK